jgi:hypothetical protein
MEDRHGHLELLAFAALTLLFVAIYAFLALILYTLDVDDKLAARGVSKLQYRMMIFALTILSIVLYINLT